MIKGLAHVEAGSDNVIQLRGENVVLHEGKLAQDLQFPEDLSGRVLMVKRITDLLDGHLFIGCAMAGLNDPSETALAANFKKFEIGLYDAPKRGKLHHLTTFVSEQS